MAGLARWAVVCTVAASAALPAQDHRDPPENEVVVIARKMRKVRLEYRMFGPYLKSCDAVVSSGDARIDRIMCAILNTCINEGYRHVVPARTCLHRKIDSIDAQGADGLAASIAAPAPAPPVGTEAIEKTGTVPDPRGDIVVTAPRLPAAGYWRFRIMSAAIGANAPPASWGQCIKADAVATTLQQMIGSEVNYTATSACRFVKLEVSDGKVVGERRCISRWSRATMEIEGTYDAGQVLLERRVRMTALRGRSSDGMDREGVSMMTGSRVGECRGK